MTNRISVRECVVVILGLTMLVPGANKAAAQGPAMPSRVGAGEAGPNSSLAFSETHPAAPGGDGIESRIDDQCGAWWLCYAAASTAHLRL